MYISTIGFTLRWFRKRLEERSGSKVDYLVLFTGVMKQVVANEAGGERFRNRLVSGLETRVVLDMCPNSWLKPDYRIFPHISFSK